MRLLGILLLATGAGTIALAQTRIGMIRAYPFASPGDVAALESRVFEAPEDLNARMALLQLYDSMAPPPGQDDPARRSLRLQQILYLIEHHPEAAVSGSKAAYVYRANGPYANAADHDAARGEWLAAAQGHPKDTAAIINAVRFLEVEDKRDAEQVLKSALDADPANREVAANLGFLYAKEILASDLAAHASDDLEQSSNAIVLAAAGTALPNLSMRMSAGRELDHKLFDLASQLSARAREFAPGDRDIQGPMPLIQYFTAAQGEPLLAPPSPARVRVAEEVQAAKLIRKTQPPYPPDTLVSGQVQMKAIIGRDGTVQSLQLINGPPQLVDSSMRTVKTWLYAPTLFHGTPMEVETTVTIKFPPN